MFEKLSAMYKAHKRAVYFFIMLVGIVLLTWPLVSGVYKEIQLIKDITSAVGVAFVTSSLIFLIMGDSHDAMISEYRNLFDKLDSNNKITLEANQIGLSRIIYSRSSLEFDELFNKNGIQRIDICGVTLKTPLYSRITSGRLAQLINDGAQVRVLLAHPESSHLYARMIAEDNHSLKANAESVANRLVDLIQASSKDTRGGLELNFIDASKDSFYLRIDDLIYAYSYSYGQDASNEPVFVYKSGTKGGEYLSKVFESKWEARSHLHGKQRENLFKLKFWLKKNSNEEYDNLVEVLDIAQRLSFERNGCRASAELCLAALAHDIERYRPKRIVKPQMDPSSPSYDSQYSEYKKKHQENSKTKFLKIARELDIDDALANKAAVLIANHDVPATDKQSLDLEILRVADGYVFFKNDTKEYEKNNGRERLWKKAKFMWRFSEKDISRHPELKKYQKELGL